jgi:hypothetical protein
VSNGRKTRAGERKAGVADPVFWGQTMSDNITGIDRYIRPTDIRRALEGREEHILDAVNIPWRTGRPHIRCPYPDHDDANPSWRWDVGKRWAYCTCGSDPILGVLMRAEAIDLDAAKLRAADILGPSDLILESRRRKSRGGVPLPPILTARPPHLGVVSLSMPPRKLLLMSGPDSLGSPRCRPRRSLPVETGTRHRPVVRNNERGRDCGGARRRWLRAW